MIRILIVDDQKSVREMLKATLSTEPDFQVVGTVDDGDRAIEQVKQLRPDILLLDMVMPNMDGVTTTQILRQNAIATKIIILSVCDDENYLLNSIRAGASGYLLKTTSPLELKETIRTIYRGYSQFGPGLLEKITQQQPIGSEVGASRSYSTTSTSTIDPTESISSDSPSKSKTDKPLQPDNHKKLNWRLIVALLAITTAVVGGVEWLGQKWKKPIPSLVSNQLPSSTNVELSGTIKPDKTVKIAANIPSLIEDIYVEMGERVVKNQPLLLLDNLEAQKAVQQKQQQQQIIEQQKQNAIARSQTLLSQIQELEAQIARLSQDSTPLLDQIAQARVQTAIAENNVDTIPAAQKDSLEITRTIYQQAQSKLDRYNQLYQQGAITQDSLQKAQAELKIAQSDYKKAQASTTATQELETAIANQVQLEQELVSLQTEQQLSQAQSQLETAQQEYEQLSQQLELLEQKANEITQQSEIETSISLRASTDGVVVALPAKVGQQTSDGQVLVDLAELETLRVEVSAKPLLVEGLRLGQKATITATIGENSHQFVGEIATIDPIADQNENHIVELKFNNPNRYLLVDQVATVEFEI